MQEKEEIELKEEGTAAGTSAPAVSIKPAEKKETKKSRSFGNKMFDFMVWPAVQWLGVWGLSFLIANRAQSGNGKLNKWFTAFENWLKPRLSVMDKPTAKQIWGSETNSQKWATDTALFTALWMGGHVSVPIIKFFEDRRQHISSWFDKAFHKIPVDADAIRTEPKQTWTSVIKGRLSVSAMNYATFIGLGPGRSQKVQDVIGGKATDLFMKIRPQANREKVRTLANLAVFDLLFTALGAAVHYSTSRIFARKGEARKHNLIAGDSIAEPETQEADTKQQGIPKVREELKSRKPAQNQKEGWATGEEAKRLNESTNIGLRT